MRKPNCIAYGGITVYDENGKEILSIPEKIGTVRKRGKRMTSKQLAQKIKKLSPNSTLALGLEGSKKVWYKTQKEHWLGWLSEYEGPGAYERETWGGRDASYIYNHIQCAPMLLWLAEALSIPQPILLKAKKAALKAGNHGASQCAAIRRHILWETIEVNLNKKK